MKEWNAPVLEELDITETSTSNIEQDIINNGSTTQSIWDLLNKTMNSTS